VQEALANVVKHSTASRVSILLMRKEQSAVAVIGRNGVGFSPDSDGDGLGPAGMRAGRALDGPLQVESSPESCTTIVAEVPPP
jgi:signal transduction histidine kinase